MSLTQQVSGTSSYFTQKKHVCMPPRRVQLIHNDTTTTTTTIKTPPSSGKKKSVRFCSDDALEQVRLFIKTQMPLAVHSDPLPPPTHRVHLQYPNWPSKWSMYKSLASGAMIRMENIQWDNHGNRLVGRCRVANVAFEKQVTVRYSLDHWKSYREIKASFRESILSPTRLSSWDRFTFDIEVPAMTTRTTTCWTALCYHVNQQEFWDNNDGKNYQLDLVPTHPSPSPVSTPPLQLSDTDEEEEEEEEEDDDKALPLYPDHPRPLRKHALDQLTSRYSFSNAPPSKNITNALHPTLPSSQLGYQDFISKYCFYNSSIIQN